LWHRYLGLVAAAFVLILSLTGLILSHTDSLKLGSLKVGSETLLGWYGIKAPDSAVSYMAGKHWISRFGKKIYINGKEITGVQASLTGALSAADVIVVSQKDTVLLLTDKGELIESLNGAHGVPDGIRQIGLNSNGQIVVRTSDRDYTVDNNFFEWKKTKVDNAEWATTAALPETIFDKMSKAYRGSGLSLERVMLDIHSGRILGEWGVYLMDGVVVLFLVLSISGVWVWATRKK